MIQLLILVDLERLLLQQILVNPEDLLNPLIQWSLVLQLVLVRLLRLEIR